MKEETSEPVLRPTAEQSVVVWVARALALIRVGMALLWASLLAAVATRDRRAFRRNVRAISAGHAVVLGLGIVVILFGIYLILTAYYSWAPGIATLFVGLILVFLGLAETLVEAESDKRSRGRSG